MKIKKHKSIVNIRKIKRKDNGENKEKNIERLINFLEMPEELIKDNIKITLIDNRYLYLEGKNQILDYYDHYIKIKTPKLTIILDGVKMEIKDISDKELIVEGSIINITYSKWGN